MIKAELNKQLSPEVRAFFDATDRGGISLIHIHQLLDCSRSAVYLWRSKGGYPSMEFLAKMRELTVKINAAIDAKRLPIDLALHIKKALE